MRWLIALALLAAPCFVVAQSVPTGFTVETVTTGLNNPVGLGFTGDGRFFVTEKNTGNVWACDTNGNKTLSGNVPNVLGGGERGLLGICVDPSWPAAPYVYVCYSHTTPSMRISRYTITGSVANPASLALALGDRHDIITTIPDNAFNHNGGTVRFGPDGMLYASFGDDASSCAAQTTTDGRGVILRIDVSGLPAGAGGPPSIAAITPPGNPFPATASFGPVTYTYGLRNPFRFHVDQVTGNLYVADVGAGSWEEYDEVTAPGQNLGWPIFEGNQNLGGGCVLNGVAVPPIAAVSHAEGWASITSFGGRYRNPIGGAFNFGIAYEGDVFYHDYFAGQIRRLSFNGGSWSTPPAVPGQPSATNWGTGFNSVSDAVLGPDGAIYFVTNTAAGTVRRIKGSMATAFQHTLTTQGGGDALLTVENAPPFAELYIPMDFNPTIPLGTGPLVGLSANAFFTLLFPLGVQPFHVTADSNGSYVFNLPSGLPAGLVVDSVAMAFAPPTLELSIPQRTTF